MEIVRMTRAHTEALAGLERLCFSRPWSRNELDCEIDNPSACFLAAVEDGEVLGYGGMQFAAGEFYMANLAVFPEHRRKGVGKALMEALEREAESRGGEFLSLEVRPSNRAAAALYRSLGFEEAGRRKDFYSRPREDGLIMTKLLKSGKDAQEAREETEKNDHSGD